MDLHVVIGGKLGVRGAENIVFAEELALSGFDAVFEADGGIEAFQEFLGSLDSAERPALESAGCEVHGYDGSEISLKGDGGPTCLTAPVWRSPGGVSGPGR